MDQAGERVFHYGESLFKADRVMKVEYTAPTVQGVMDNGPRGLNCQFDLHADGSVHNRCPCRDNQERGIICAHVVALGLELIRRQTDPERERKALEEIRAAARQAAYNEADFIRRAAPGTAGAIPARLRLALGAGWRHHVAQHGLPVIVTVETGGRTYPLAQLPLRPTYAFPTQDENLLFVLEDIAGGPARSPLALNAHDAINLLNLQAGRHLHEEGRPETLTVNAIRMHSVLRMDLDPKSGELVLRVHTELPVQDARDATTYIVAGQGGWVFHAGHFWPLDKCLPPPLHGIYAQPMFVARPAVPHFIRTELPLLQAYLPLATEVTPDLFTIEPTEPRFRLQVRGSPASISATLLAEYAHHSFLAGKKDPRDNFALPDPDDLLRYTVRNPRRETQALERLAASGFRGETGDTLAPIVGCRLVLNFFGSGLPRLRRLGWQVQLEGRVEPFLDEMDSATPVVNIQPGAGRGWFEVNFSYENRDGQSLSEVEIQRALLKGDSYIERDGRTILFDGDAITTARNVFDDCAGDASDRPGAFRMDGQYAAYVQSSLDALDGVDVEVPPEWQVQARRRNRLDPLEPEPLSAGMEAVLRPYQKQAVYWLRFLEKNGLAGILADEMGLGKTLETLAWLQLVRARAEAQGRPALIVCPTSLVENWAEEAGRFAPDLRVLPLRGGDRHEKWELIASHHVVVTSYALMRRDIERYHDHEFAAVVLDEAQHIKNRSTQNAIAAKKLKAFHRLVLTGTPIENSVADLWSIMDFLMPAYLGGPQRFRDQYELPIARGGADADLAQSKLRRKLHPFLLRRLKKDVAADLPPKISRVATCLLTADQQMVYQQYLTASRLRLTELVRTSGFQRARMEIFKTLLRLRQICCHLELLKLADLKSQYPSGKMDLFFELLDEALDGGHRVLVFSQFTSMLAILRRELEQRERRYCYLDGATQDRMTVVRQFNTDASIPVFLISLKAGGTGLNLTGADTVIHFDPWWNPAVEDQATDRAYRIGQRRTVYSIKLITKGTVEEKVLALQQKKQAVISATLAREEQFTQKLSWDDIQELLDT